MPTLGGEGEYKVFLDPAEAAEDDDEAVMDLEVIIIIIIIIIIIMYLEDIAEDRHHNEAFHSNVNTLKKLE